MSDDVVSQVRAAIQQCREKAQKATQGAWKLWGMQVRAGDDPDVDLSKLVADTADEDRGLFTFNAAHIAANDPASVLRLCDGMEAILDRHKPFVGTALNGDVYEYCEFCAEERYSPPWPCPDFRSLASMLGVTGETE